MYFTRTGPNTARIQSQIGNIFTCQQRHETDIANLFKNFHKGICDETLPFEPGQTITLKRFTAEILAVDESGLPTDVRYTFDVPLDDPSLRWVYYYWHEDIYKPFEFRPIGEKRKIWGPFSYHVWDDDLSYPLINPR
jgi:hypothetical protein